MWAESLRRCTGRLLACAGGRGGPAACALALARSYRSETVVDALRAARAPPSRIGLLGRIGEQLRFAVASRTYTPQPGTRGCHASSASRTGRNARRGVAFASASFDRQPLALKVLAPLRGVRASYSESGGEMARGIRRCVVAAAMAVVAAVGLMAGPVQAAGGNVDASIKKFLRENPTAVRVSPYQVSWSDGALMTWADPRTGSVPTDPVNRVDLRGGGEEISTLDVEGCPSGAFTTNKYCFYEHSSWGGRMLQFADCGSTQFLNNYGFTNQTSSWVNTTSNTVNVWSTDKTTGYLWSEAANSKSSYVGSTNNDRADYFQTLCP